MKKWNDILKNLTLLSQLGLSLVTPLLMCLFFCWFLVTKAGLPAWIYIPGFFFGLGGSGMVAYKLYLRINADEKKKKRDKKDTISFNRHL